MLLLLTHICSCVLGQERFHVLFIQCRLYFQLDAIFVTLETSFSLISVIVYCVGLLPTIKDTYLRMVRLLIRVGGSGHAHLAALPYIVNGLVRR